MTKEQLHELIFVNLGQASMCWSETPKGVFNSTKAVELGREILKAIEDVYVEEVYEDNWYPEEEEEVEMQEPSWEEWVEDRQEVQEKIDSADKAKCKLKVGSTFMFQGRYCIVTKMSYNSFNYIRQEEPDVERYMYYWYYLTTPSAAGRRLNK